MTSGILNREDNSPPEPVTVIRSFVPNILSFSRIPVSPFIFIAIKNDNLTLVIGLALWAMLSDYLDGFLARRWQVMSEAGKILDPLGDKLCIAAGATALSLYRDFPLFLTVIIIGRDIFILLFGLAIAGKIKHVPGSNIIGKITVTVLAVVLLIYVLNLAYLYTIAVAAAIIAILLSSISYLSQAYRIVFNKT